MGGLHHAVNEDWFHLLLDFSNENIEKLDDFLFCDMVQH
jgi:hypothetical protein